MTKDQKHSLHGYITHLRNTGGRFYPIGAIVSPDDALDEVFALLRQEKVEVASVNSSEAPDDALELVFDNLLEGKLVVLHVLNELSPDMTQQLRYIADGIMHVTLHGKLEQMESLPTAGQLVVLMDEVVYEQGVWEDSLTSMFRV